MDLKSEKMEPEKNFINYALFVSFFPTITSGPIQRGRKLIPQIRERHPVSFSAFQEAVFIFTWGAFIKMVLSDRLGIFVDAVYSGSYTGWVQVAAACAYSVQIYTDFAGYSFMAIAVAKLFGFDLDENFHQPYFAKTIADFWHRWHISLTSWFTEYLYFPLGGNRKGKPRQYLNILIVFLVSGLWHGAAWSFVFWGCLHAVFQIAAHVTRKSRLQLAERFHVNMESAAYRVWQSICIFAITTFVWIFFRAGGFMQAVEFIQRVFAEWNPWVLFDGSLFHIGLDPFEWNICWGSLLLLFIISIAREKGYNVQAVMRQPAVVRVLIWWFLFFSCLILGIYGEGYNASAFIYAGF